MKIAFARALVALSLVSLPATALASTKLVKKHSSVAAKEPKKKAKHHPHKSTSKGLATHSTKASAEPKAREANLPAEPKAREANLPAEPKARETSLPAGESKSSEPKAR